MAVITHLASMNRKTLDKFSKHINFCLLVTLTLKNQNHAYHNPFTNTMPRTLSRKTLVLNPSCIDIFITNSPLSFQNTIAISNGLSDVRKMVIRRSIPVVNDTIQITNILIRPNLKTT